MKESFRICPEKSNHRFAATEYYLYNDTCPFCKCRMPLVEMETIIKKRKTSQRRANKDKNAIGYDRGIKIDSLPRISWFSDAIEYNEVEQIKSHDTWTLDDAKELMGLYTKHGEGNAKTWNTLASDMGRSLYAVERQLRIMINCPDE